VPVLVFRPYTNAGFLSTTSIRIFGLAINLLVVGLGRTVHPRYGGLGASDTGMKKEEIAKVERVVLLPMTAGSVVMAYNPPDVQNSTATA